MIRNIEVFTQNSIRIDSDEGRIYIDPFKMKEAPKDAAFILITHEHYDHFSPEDIEKTAKKDTILVCPESMKYKAADAAELVGRIETVKPGEAREIGGLKLETVPAYNPAKPFHPESAKWIGYIVVTGGKRVYIAGDTDATKEAEAVKCDIALVPVGGKYTMDAKEAAALINKIRPETAIPLHYGEGLGSADAGKEFSTLVDKSIKVELIKQY